MADEERLKLLAEDLKGTGEELRQILIEIRAFVMEVQNPMRRFERENAAIREIQEGGNDNGDGKQETGK